MRKSIVLASLALGMLSVPAAAQDSMSMASDNLDAAGSFAGTVAVNSHLDGDDGTTSRRSNARSAVTPQQREACNNLPRFKAEHGAGDSRVQFLTRQCRSRGL